MIVTEKASHPRLPTLYRAGRGSRHLTYHPTTADYFPRDHDHATVEGNTETGKGTLTMPSMSRASLQGVRALWCLAALSLALFLVSSLGASGEAMGRGESSEENLILYVQDNLQAIDTQALPSSQPDIRPNRLLTADIHKVPLRKVLSVLAEKTGVKIQVVNTVPDDELFVRFDRLSVEEGIKRILKDQSYILIYSRTPALSEGKNAGTLTVAQIHILPKGSSEAPRHKHKIEGLDVPIDEQSGPLTELAKQALEAEKATDRLAALKEFIDLTEDAELVAIIPALEDEDQRVRKMALDALYDLDNLPVELITYIALADGSPEMRMSALELLVETQGKAALTTMQQALNDPDPRVREIAQEMLEQEMLEEANKDESNKDE